MTRARGRPLAHSEAGGIAAAGAGDVSAATAAAALTRLADAAERRGRPAVVLVDEDLSALGADPARCRAIIAALERGDQLQRVRRGTYVLNHPGHARPPSALELVGALTPGAHLISGAAALRHHQLTQEHPGRVDVWVCRSMPGWSWRGDTVRYARSRRPLAAGDRRTARVAPAALAIVDAVAHPAWGVSLAAITGAMQLMLLRGPALGQALAEVCRAHVTHAAVRRIGYLLTAIAGPAAAAPLLELRGTGNAYALLQSGGRRDGPIDRTWKVRCNVELAGLLHTATAPAADHLAPSGRPPAAATNCDPDRPAAPTSRRMNRSLVCDGHERPVRITGRPDRRRTTARPSDLDLSQTSTRASGCPAGCRAVRLGRVGVAGSPGEHHRWCAPAGAGSAGGAAGRALERRSGPP